MEINYLLIEHENCFRIIWVKKKNDQNKTFQSLHSVRGQNIKVFGIRHTIIISFRMHLMNIIESTTHVGPDNHLLIIQENVTYKVT